MMFIIVTLIILVASFTIISNLLLLTIEKAREIVKFIKDSKLRVQASINGDFVRVSGKDRDTLQSVIALLKAKDFGIDTQFTNYRSQ